MLNSNKIYTKEHTNKLTLKRFQKIFPKTSKLYSINNKLLTLSV